MIQFPDTWPVENGRIFAAFCAIIAANSNICPFWLFRGCLVIEGSQNIDELPMQGFLKTDEGLRENGVES
jgi:hypothetical protein